MAVATQALTWCCVMLDKQILAWHSGLSIRQLQHGSAAIFST